MLTGEDFGRRSRCFRTNVLSPRCRKARLIVVGLFACVWGGVLLHRLVSLQITDFERWQEWAVRQHFSEVTVASERGPVLDRNGKLLAVSVPAGSVYARPHQLRDKERTARELATILEMPYEQVAARLESAQPFVWIARQVSRRTAEKVTSLGTPGVGFILESRRYYPYNTAAATLIGKVGVDGVGLSGIESLFEERLHGEQIRTKVTRDAFGNVIQVNSNDEGFAPPRGDALTLTLDAELQVIVDEELEAGRLRANARGAIAVMLDSDSGEVLAVSNAPLVNFNHDKISSKTQLSNPALEKVFEPGSILKPIVAAAAIEAGVVRPNELIDCENGRFSFGRHTIKDVHGSSVISFRDVVVRSSNIGMTKVGARLGRERLYDALRTFGFGEPSGLRFPGETAGILRPASRWAEVDIATHSFGQGVAVNALQMARATAAIANGGILPPIRLISDRSERTARRVISEDTARAVREMMYGVVEDDHGTGGRAEIEGVRIGGKTGTAQVARTDGRGYQPGAYIASFVGFADASAIGVHKRLTMVVVVEEPRKSSIYGGTVAAPIFKRIMARSLRYLATQRELQNGVLRAPKAPAEERTLLPVTYRS